MIGPLQLLNRGDRLAQKCLRAVEIATIPAVVEIEAISGERTAGTIPIRGFLRFGPTYPTVDPPPTAPPPDYPES